MLLYTLILVAYGEAHIADYNLSASDCIYGQFQFHGTPVEAQCHLQKYRIEE
jgi:hypothetical protein